VVVTKGKWWSGLFLVAWKRRDVTLLERFVSAVLWVWWENFRGKYGDARAGFHAFDSLTTPSIVCNIFLIWCLVTHHDRQILFE
jgi:hypothetical protein